MRLALASLSVLVHSAEGLLLGAIIDLPAIHLGTSEFLAVFDNAVIATVEIICATFRVLASSAAFAALEFGENLHKLLH